MTVGSLFAGIGGFDLGFERAGFEVKWQVEIDPFCRAVLAKHWPDVRRYEDVRFVTREPSILRGWHGLAPVDVICGGFPCQPHSLAGRRRASADERDLWGEFARIIREVKPRWVVAENVPGLLSSESGRFFGRVLRDLAESGYDAEWDCLPASAFGARHRRDRVWIVAYPQDSAGWRRAERRPGGDWGSELDGADWSVADTEGERGQQAAKRQEPRQSVFELGSQGRIERLWEPEPNVGRVAHGVPARVDRLRGLGNAIVPQIAEWIARRIQEAEGLS